MADSDIDEDEGRFDEEEEEEEDEKKIIDKEFLQACLPVSGAPMPPSAEPPKDADEYLRQVQWERMHCPEIMDADVEERPRRRKKPGLVGRDGNLLASFGIIELPEECKPRQQWTQDAADSFRALRAQCQDMRCEADGHQRLTFDVWRERCAKGRPSSQFLATQDFTSINHLVVVLVELFATAQEVAETPAVDVEDPFTSEDGLMAEWAFAVLLFVEEPLFDDIQYQLQRLRRACQKALMSPPDASKSGAGAEGASPSDGRARAALLLTIVQEVFNQR